MAEFLRNIDNERHARAGVVEPAFGAWQTDAMIRPEHNDGVLGRSVFVQLIQNPADPVIQRRDQFVVIRPIAPRRRGVRIIGRQIQAVGILALLRLERLGQAREALLVCVDGAFVRSRNIEYREKGLALRSVFPVRARTGFVPDVLRHFRHLIIGLGVVRAVIACFAQIKRKEADVRRQGSRAAHVVSAERRMPHPGDDRRSVGRADSGDRVGVGKTIAARRQRVERWRVGMRIAIATERRAGVLAAQPKDVRPKDRRRTRRCRKGQRRGRAAKRFERIAPLNLHDPPPLAGRFELRRTHYTCLLWQQKQRNNARGSDRWRPLWPICHDGEASLGSPLCSFVIEDDRDCRGQSILQRSRQRCEIRFGGMRKAQVAPCQVFGLRGATRRYQASQAENRPAEMPKRAGRRVERRIVDPRFAVLKEALRRIGIVPARFSGEGRGGACPQRAGWLGESGNERLETFAECLLDRFAVARRGGGD
ncbi:MAG: hypothetical protein BWZ10_02917 [candidate division BRC1 bacterium ADurb.BinA364]|nr:MAG: hypothetical protein BWZ10_02917 [candidate division BRC1 bacterium ADurb.BinA364]